LADLRETLAMVSSVLVPARQVRVNDNGKHRAYDGQVQNQVLGPSNQSHSTSLSVYNTEMGSLLVLSRKTLRSQGPLESGQPESQGLRQLEEEDMTSITVVSGLFQARRTVKLSTCQTHTDNGVFSAIPQLLVYNILPAHSPVFSIVREGRLKEFQALLREGKASLRDQDEYGASLLFVSVFV